MVSSDVCGECKWCPVMCVENVSGAQCSCVENVSGVQ